MSKIEVDAIVPQSGTTLTVGESGDTITIPSGATLDASNATTTLPSTVVTTTGSQTLTNKTIDVSQLSGTVATSNLGTGTADATTFLRGDQTYASATPAAGSITTTQLAYNPNSFRNIIINGDMSIAQRGTSASSVTATQYLLDRFRFGVSVGTWTISQDTDIPAGQGFAKSFKADCTSSASPTSGQVCFLQQFIEGQNLQYLKKGTANATSLTASFWVKSNKTGTYVLEIFDTDNSRTISKSYTINSADTWEQKTITFAGDTTGTLDNDNAKSFEFNFWLSAGTNFTSGTLATSWEAQTNVNRAVGQVNLADSTSNYINITGVQLEAGTTASDFEFLPVDVNLGRCKRYFISYGGSYAYQRFGGGLAYTTSNLVFIIEHGIKLRATPTLTYSNISDIGTWDGGVTSITALSFDGFGESLSTVAAVATGRTQYRPYQLLANNTINARINFSAEL